MSELQYKCPCCDGAIEFDTASQNMKCPYCDTEFAVETLAAYDSELKNEVPEDMSWQTDPGAEWSEDEVSGLRYYVCEACGGEIVADQTTAATSCPFCGNHVIMSGQFAGMLKPDYVIPFKLDKNAAKEALRKHYMGKRLLPKIFKDENHIDEVKGVYVPVWLFDTEADADIRYKCSKVRTWRDARYDYTETSYFSVRRGGNLSFARVPVDGSEKMDDTLMESIEPFNFAEAVDFRTAYLSGFLADKYDVSAEDSIERANFRIKRSTEDAFRKTVEGYDSVSEQSTSIRLNNGEAKYALYPVWLLSTSWNGERYIFAMNGQTGKFAGDLPLDKSAYKRWLFGLTGAITAVAFGLSWLLWML